MSGCAWVTLATNDTYCLGALVLAHSLKKVSTRHQLAIIITPQVSPSMREQLSSVFDVVQLVDVLDSQDAANLALLQRPDLGVTFTKIHCWNLIQFSKCVFLDADTLVIQNCDELMEREELSAAPDPGWPDCFNSGVFVFSPSQETFKQLIQFASTHGSFDGGDQGLLNMYFNDWPTSDIRKHLSFLYNMCSTSTYTYLPALKYYGANIKIVHFIGANKPWLLGPSGAGMSTFNQAWWDTFQSCVVQTLSKDMSGLAGALGSKERSAIEEQWRKQNWEQGNIDFTGKDSFENIWQKIMDAVNKPKAETPKPVQALVPKEIASQAISEKEKADLPEGEVAKEDLAVEAKEVQPTETNKMSAPLTLASVTSEIPNQKPPTPITTSEAPPKEDVPIPMPLLISEKSDTPVILESPKPLETPKTPEPLPAGQAVVEPVLEMQAVISQQETIKLEEPKLDIAGDLPKIEDILKGLEQTLLAEQMKDERKEPVPATPETPKIPNDAAQEQKKVEESQASPPVEAPQVPLPELPKTDTPKVEESKPQATEAPVTAVPQTEAPVTPTPQTEAPVTATPQKEAPVTPTPQTEAPVTATPQKEAPVTPTPQTETPVTATPQKEAPMTPTPQTEAPETATPQTEAPSTPQTEASPTPVSQTEVPLTPKPKSETPIESTTQSETPIIPVPQPDTSVSPPEVLKVETPKTEVQPQIASPEVPKPTEAPKTDVPEAPKLETVQPIPEGIPTAPQSETKEAATELKMDEGKKLKEGQKPAKQQAPQPPPKNGKPKKGQQPEPTSAHPLADMPIQADAAKEEQTMLPQEPLTPPTSPDSQVKEPEPQVKVPELQPGTPTVTAPTPPVTPSDAFKVEDPLSSQIKSDEATSATGSTGGADAPVPPKRKGKANEKQPPKPQNNGAKGKGKK